MLAQLVKETESGELYSDRARVANPAADLSAEPDIVFVSNDALESGRARLVPAASGKEDDFIEIEGSPDFIVEIVSNRSVVKDTQHLPRAYWRAEIREYWLVDARGEQLAFEVQHRGAHGYETVVADPGGFQVSRVFAKRFRLTRRRNQRGRWEYDLEVR